MKLISCYINHFGKLVDKSYDFTSGINSFIEENGAGKSTLAAFIKAMLYGMDSVTTATAEFKDRRHYAPFDNSTFGGNLIFEHNGKTYRVERSFDLKSLSKDVTTIYVDGEEASFEYEIGQVILGLDKGSYERLLFINSNDIEIGSNGDIKKNLNNLIDNTVEGVDFENVLESLKTLEKELNPNKKGSKSGYFKDYRKKLEAEIANQKTISNGLNEKYLKRKQMDVELNSLREKESLAKDIKVLKECWDNYEQQLSNISSKENELHSLNLKYPEGVPSEEELEKCKQNIQDKLSLERIISATKFNEQKLTELNSLKQKFKNGYPSEEELHTLETLYTEKSDIETKLKYVAFSEEEKSKLDELSLKFKEDVPSEDKLKEIEEDINKYNDLSSEKNNLSVNLSIEDNELINRFDNLDSNKDLDRLESLVKEYKEVDSGTVSTTQAIAAKGKSNKVLGIILLLISLACVGAGISLFFSVLYAGLALTVVGVVGLIATGFLYLKNRIDSYSSATNVSTQVKDQNRIKNISDKVHELLSPYQIYTGSIYSDYEKFKFELNRYNELKEKVKQSNLKLEEVESSSSLLSNKLNNFFAKYGYNEEYLSSLYGLKLDIKELTRLTGVKKNCLNEKAKLEAILNEKLDAIKSILSKYEIDISSNFSFLDLKQDCLKIETLTNEFLSNKEITENNLNKLALLDKEIGAFKEKYAIGVSINNDFFNLISSDLYKLSSLKKEIEALKISASKYKNEKKLGEEKPVFEFDEDLSNRINILADELIRLDNDIESDERDIDSLADNESKLIEVKNEIQELDHKHKITLKTIEKINDAQKVLDSKYVAPIRSKFDYYSSLLGDILGYKIEMNRDFEISLDINGQLKSYKHLSSGQRSICALCFRLALLDNIYSEKIPFIVMDDPFVSLDDSNFKATIDLIKKLSDEKQIIYFACHSSREVKNN